MELFSGNWYKNTAFEGFAKYFKFAFESDCGCYTKVFYSDLIRDDLSYIKETDYYVNGRITEGLKKVPLSEIQQYLPDGHPDKEFVLPEKWCVKRNKDSYKAINEWFERRENNHSNYIFTSYDGYLTSDHINCKYWITPPGNRPVGYTEITFEQFKKYVLKQDNMDKEIIGYKLKEDCKQYLIAAEKIAGYLPSRYNDLEYFLKKVNWGTMKANLEKAGVLDLWFEPIYKEEFNIGDWVLLSNDAGGYGSHPRDVDNKILQITDIRPYEGKEGSGYYYFGKERTVKKEIVRKATPEEIKEVTKPKYPQIEINGYKGEFFDDYVKFGCAVISKWIFIELNKCEALNHSHIYGNKEVESVTIGKGTFSKDQIKQIAEYCINKE